MAITKIYAIRNRLDKRVSYAVNEEKTNLDGLIEYAVNPNKTEKRLFEAQLNCKSVETAFEDMMKIKQHYGKTGGVLGYHFIQSFKPGEVTPEQAHQCGIEFAKRLFGDKFQVVIGTHLDKSHLHNHIVINSVSFRDGKKYHSSPESYYNMVRATSDEICRENNLFVIEPKSKGKHYAQWKAEKDGSPTIRSQVKQDIDDIISQSLNFSTFLAALKKAGYTVKYGNVKHTAVKPPNGKKFIRLDGLGKDYTDDAIRERIMAITSWKPKSLPEPKRYYFRGTFNRAKKCTGLRAQYFRYVYLIRSVRKGTATKKVSRYLLEDTIKFERYLKQHKFLVKHKIDSADELYILQSSLENEIDRLVTVRKPLYDERRNAENEEMKQLFSDQIAEINVELKAVRSDLRLCKQIAKDSETVQERVSDTQELQKEKEKKESCKLEKNMIKFR